MKEKRSEEGREKRRRVRLIGIYFKSSPFYSSLFLLQKYKEMFDHCRSFSTIRIFAKIYLSDVVLHFEHGTWPLSLVRYVKGQSSWHMFLFLLDLDESSLATVKLLKYKKEMLNYK